MPEHFLALIKQLANLASNDEAERTATAFVSSLAATLDESIYSQIDRNLPDYLFIKQARHFFLKRSQDKKRYNQDIFLDRIMLTLDLTDRSEAENRVSAVMQALLIVQPNSRRKLSASLPTDLNKYW